MSRAGVVDAVFVFGYDQRPRLAVVAIIARLSPVPLPFGARLRPNEVLSVLGAGGMGEVYRALDTKLKRDVALKVLPQAFAQDPDRLARFQREAELLATLNHPNAAAIFSIEEAGGVHFMTMELVDGCTLEQMTPRGTVSLAQLFDIAIALADALSAAHRKHIIHRDLKPANVMMTDDGRVKVPDVGLARAVDPDPVCPEDDTPRAHPGRNRRHGAVHVARTDRSQTARSSHRPLLARPVMCTSHSAGALPMVEPVCRRCAEATFREASFAAHE